MRRLRRVGCPTGAASTVSARRACQRCASSARPEEVNAPGPACNATRHGSEASSIPGRSPVAAWPQESTRQPPRRSSYEPPSDSMWPIVPSAGRLPARHRDFCDSGTGLRLSAPTSASADHAAGGSSVVAAPYHAVTRASRTIFLAIPLPPLARRPHLAPVTTPLAPVRTRSPVGAVTGGMRAGSPPNPRRRSNARGASRRPRPSQWISCSASASIPRRARSNSPPGCGRRCSPTIR